MLSISYHVALFLSLGGLGVGMLFIIYLLRKMRKNKMLAFQGDRDASNHLILPCYRPVFFLLALVYGLQFVFVTVFYYLVYVQDSLDKAMLMVCIYFCATFLQIPYAMSPMLLWVPSLSRGGFRRVGSILIPWCLISVVVLVCLIVLKEGTTRRVLLICQLVLTCLPSVFLSVGILSKQLSSRVEVRSRSSRSSTAFLLVYSMLVACFGTLCASDLASSAGILGLGITVLLNAIFPLALYSTLNADTKFWRGLGRHNQGGLGSSNGETSTAESMTLRVASTHLQSVLSDLSSLMIDFAYIEIGANIGRGASAYVYKAEYKQKKVAIKVLNPPEITEEELVSIREETCINSIMSHPSIVVILGICVRPPEIGIVMEYCSKGTLKQSLQTHAQEWTALRRLRAAADLAAAVAHVHSKGYMHRDIKADNLFVTDKWKIKLGDFGESRAILKLSEAGMNEAAKERDSAQWDQRMTVLGTVAYMAPELVNAQKQYTEAIDIYAMAITFWEIWTGNDPFAQENTFSLYQLIVQGARPDIPSSCPQKFHDVMNAAWNTDAEQRPTALAIAEQMNILIEDFQEAASAALLASYSEPPTVENVKGVSSLEIAPPSKRDKTPKSDVKYNFTHAASENNMDSSFQYADSFGNSEDIGGRESSFSNPLKNVYQKASKQK